MIERMIFIGGCDRSGTTLLGAMLGAHPDCVCVPESQFKEKLLRWEPAPDLETVHHFLTHHWRFKLWEMPIALEEIAAAYGEKKVSEIMLRLVQLYGQKVGLNGGSIWVDHTPHNIRQVRMLREIWPQAKFLHIVRDGRAVAASVLPLDWGPNSIVEAAHFWIENTAYGLAAEQAFGPEVIMRVKYEELVQNPEQVMQRVAAFAGLNYLPEMCEGNGFITPRYSVGQHQLVGKRPDPSRINTWTKILSKRQCEIFEHFSEDFLDYLGYPRTCEKVTEAPSFSESLTMKSVGMIRRNVTNRVRMMFRRWASTGVLCFLASLFPCNLSTAFL